MNFELTTLPVADIESDIEVIIIVDNDTKHRFVQDKKLLKRAGFSAGQDETCLLVEKNRLYVGAGVLESREIRISPSSSPKNPPAA